jgi:hypothetical protein
MTNVHGAVREFFQKVAKGAIEIYNECSLQHELGIFLRRSLRRYKVQFERPVGFFGFARNDFVKSEIDLSIFTPDSVERVAIEVKFPRNGQHPEQMFKFCQDIAFLEQLVSAGFDAGFFVVAAHDPLFYRGTNQAGIYSHFRGGAILSGTITKPTGAQDEFVNLCGSYDIRWEEVKAPLRFACVAAAPTTKPMRLYSARRRGNG